MAKKKLIYIGIGCLILAVIYLPGFSRLQQLKEENRNLEKRIEILEKANTELEEVNEKLEKDPNYVEKIAREKLGMTRKGEIILK